MQEKRPHLLSIAGLDPSGGAGLLADIKTMEQLRVNGLSVCTCMTLQTEAECFSATWRPTEEILGAVQFLMNHFEVDTVKIGIIKEVGLLTEVVNLVKSINPNAQIVWDPVLKSTSDFSFFDLESLQYLPSILKEISLVTPNYPEYELLKPYLFPPDQRPCSVLIKGGHNEWKPGTDILYTPLEIITLKPHHSSDQLYPKHGSGCVLSSAIASYLALGEDLENACRKGKTYIEEFLKSTPHLIGFHAI